MYFKGVNVFSLTFTKARALEKAVNQITLKDSTRKNQDLICIFRDSDLSVRQHIKYVLETKCNYE